MMQGSLFKLALDNDFSLLNFKERKKPPTGFYAVLKGEMCGHDDIEIEREGLFFNFYPKDEWYRRLAQDFFELTVPNDYPVSLTRKEAVLRTLHLLQDYTGMRGTLPRFIVPAAKLDGLCYHSVPPNVAVSSFTEATGNNPAFYLYGAYHAALCRAGSELALTCNVRRLLISMAFFEADMLRALKRGDTSVLLKRVLKTADLYYDCVYEEGGAFGRISTAVARFLEASFFLFSSNILNEEQFLPLQ